MVKALTETLDLNWRPFAEVVRTHRLFAAVGYSFDEKYKDAKTIATIERHDAHTMIVAAKSALVMHHLERLRARPPGICGEETAERAAAGRGRSDG